MKIFSVVLPESSRLRFQRLPQPSSSTSVVSNPHPSTSSTPVTSSVAVAARSANPVSQRLSSGVPINASARRVPIPNGSVVGGSSRQQQQKPTVLHRLHNIPNLLQRTSVSSNTAAVWGQEGAPPFHSSASAQASSLSPPSGFPPCSSSSNSAALAKVARKTPHTEIGAGVPEVQLSTDLSVHTEKNIKSGTLDDREKLIILKSSCLKKNISYAPVLRTWIPHLHRCICVGIALRRRYIYDVNYRCAQPSGSGYQYSNYRVKFTKGGKENQSPWHVASRHSRTLTRAMLAVLSWASDNLDLYRKLCDHSSRVVVNDEREKSITGRSRKASRSNAMRQNSSLQTSDSLTKTMATLSSQFGFRIGLLCFELCASV
ncbi:hypothetical protein ACTXT7_012235 [Hymenolepis weldensis]